MLHGNVVVLSVPVKATSYLRLLFLPSVVLIPHFANFKRLFGVLFRLCLSALLLLPLGLLAILLIEFSFAKIDSLALEGSYRSEGG